MLSSKHHNIKAVYQVLRWYYLDNVSQQEIARRLNLPNATVAEYLEYGRDQKLIEVKLNLPVFESNVSMTASGPPKTSYKELGTAIQKRFDIKECRIVISFPDTQQTLKAIAKELGTMLEGILQEGGYLGIGWGTTMEAMARYVWISKKVRVMVIPTATGTDMQVLESSINFLARFFANKIGGSYYAVTIPCIADSKEAKQAHVKNPKMLEFITLAKKITIGLASIGRISPDAALFKKSKISQQEVEDLQGLGLIGNINFTFFDQQGKCIPNKLGERIIDVFPLELMQKTGNMIGVSFGDDKAEVIRAALKGKFIHRLITDHHTAEKVLKEK